MYFLLHISLRSNQELPRQHFFLLYVRRLFFCQVDLATFAVYALIYGNMVACVCCCCVACGNRAVRNDTDVLQGISCYRFLLLSVCCMCAPCYMPHTTLEKNRRASTISVHQLKRINPPFPHYTHTYTLLIFFYVCTCYEILRKQHKCNKQWTLEQRQQQQQLQQQENLLQQQ